MLDPQSLTNVALTRLNRLRSEAFELISALAASSGEYVVELDALSRHSVILTPHDVGSSGSQSPESGESLEPAEATMTMFQRTLSWFVLSTTTMLPGLAGRATGGGK